MRSMFTSSHVVEIWTGDHIDATRFTGWSSTGPFSGAVGVELLLITLTNGGHSHEHSS